MDKNENAVELFDKIENLTDVKKINLGDGVDVISVPRGRDIRGIKEYLDQYLENPERRTGTAQFFELESFIAHVNRFKDEDSVIFADNDVTSPKMTAIIDYHKKGFDGQPRYGMHKSTYTFPLSGEWEAWLANDGAKFTQAEFALFLEERITDILAPGDNDLANEKLEQIKVMLGGTFAGPSTLRALSIELKVNEESKVTQRSNLNTGESTLLYQNEHKDDQGQPVKVPNMFLIGVPVFMGGDVYSIIVLLRYRLQQGNVTWTYNLYRVRNVFEDAFKGICEQVKQGTELPLYVGKPEN